MPKDFLRQVVNPTLLEFEIPVQILSEIRKKLEAAENKYNFSAFGGDVKKLADFLKSPLWQEIVSLFESSDALPALVKILERAKEAYKDYPEVVQAIEEALKNIEQKGGERVKEFNILEEVKEKVQKIVGDLFETKISENKVVVEGDRLEAYIEEDAGKYTMKLEVRGTKETTGWKEVEDILKEAKDLATKLLPP